MAVNVNQVEIIGYLGSDPEFHKFTGKKGGVAHLSVATTTNYVNKDTGEWKGKTEWHRVSVYPDALVEKIKKTLKKGSFVRVVGKLEYSNYINKDNEKVHTVDITVRPYHGKIDLLDPATGKEREPKDAAEELENFELDDDEIAF